MAAQLVVIDKSVSGYQSLLSQIPSGYAVLQVDSSSDGWGQIASFMSRQAAAGSFSSYSALHIIGHGSAGSMKLGTSTLGLVNLSSEATTFAQIQRYMAPGADLMLYGCDIAQGAAGNAFVTQLAKATGLDVAASTDATGGAGGDWVLEKTVGAVQAQSLSLVLQKSLAAGLLLTGTGGNDTLSGTAGDDTFVGGLGDDTFLGSDGTDWADYSTATAKVVIQLNNTSQINVGGVAYSAATASGAHGNDKLISIEAVIGGSAGDLISGGSGSATLIGGAGNDTIRGVSGQDSFEGGIGNDFLEGSPINGRGWDFGSYRATGDNWVSYQSASGAVQVNLAANVSFSDSVDGVGYSFEGAGTATGADGNDFLAYIQGVSGSASADTFVGDKWNNVFRGNGGNDTINGGRGFDHADYSQATGAVTVNLLTGAVSGADGMDTLTNIEGIYGSTFADALTGDGGNNNIRGGVGNDTLDGGDGRDTVDYYTAGASVTVDLSSGTASGGDGSDTLLNFENVRGSSGFADNLSGDGRGNKVEGFGGNDTLSGNAGNDTLDGGDGNDTIFGGTGDDSIIALSGNDSIDGGDGNDTVQINVGNARMASIAGNAGGGWTLISDAVVSMGTLAVNQGTGVWTLNANGQITSFRNIEGLQIDSNNGAGNVYAELDNTAGAQKVKLTHIGTTGADTLTGTTGNDYIKGRGGNDEFIGGAGNDTLEGVIGSGGDQGVDYRSATAAVTVNLVTGTANDGQGGTDKLINLQHVWGSAYNDTITVNRFGWAEGGAGNDTLMAGDGGARLGGGAGNDQLNGSAAFNFDLASYEFGSSRIDGLSVTAVAGSGAAWTLASQGTALARLAYDSGSASWTVSDLRTNAGAENFGTDTLTNIEYLRINGIDATGAAKKLAVQLNAPGQAPSIVNRGIGSTSTTGADFSWFTGYNSNASGGDGNDTLIGSDRNSSTLVGGAGDDYLDGGYQTNFDWRPRYSDWALQDQDTASYTDVTSGGVRLDVSTMKVYALGTSGTGTDTLRGIEQINLSRGHDEIVGNFGLLSGNNALAGDQHWIGIQGLGGSDTFRPDAGTKPWQDVWLDYSWSQTGITISYTGQVGTVTYGASGSQLAGQDTVSGIVDFSGTQYSDSVDFSGLTGSNALGERWSWFDSGGGQDTVIGNGYSEVGFGSWSSANGDSKGVYVRLAEGRGTTVVDLSYLKIGEGTVGTNFTFSGVDFVAGSDGNDTLIGSSGDDGFKGDGGWDLIDGGAGTDSANYRRAKDSGVSVNMKDGIVFSIDTFGTNVGRDTLRSIEVVKGSDFADIYDARGFSATSTNAGSRGDWNQFRGNGGNDTIYGNGSTFLDYSDSSLAVDVNLAGGLAQALDTANRVGDFANIVGVDTFSGVSGVVGSSFGDRLVAGITSATLEGGGGNDTLTGGSGTADTAVYTMDDTAVGGLSLSQNPNGGWFIQSNGVNLLSLRPSVIGSSVTWTVTDTRPGVAALQVVDLGTDVLTGIEQIQINSRADGASSWTTQKVYLQNAPEFPFVTLTPDVVGTPFDDTLIGTAANDTMNGQSGNDLIMGIGGNDSLLGGDGRDTLDGGAGNDTLDGGNGARDHVIFSGATNGVVVDLVMGTASDGQGGTDVLRNIENVIGTSFADQITIGRGDFATGSAGNDVLTVSATGLSWETGGYLNGGAGDDTITGNSAMDIAAYDMWNTRLDGVSIAATSANNWSLVSNGSALMNLRYDAANGQWITTDSRGVGTSDNPNLGTDTLKNVELVFLRGSDAAVSVFKLSADGGAPSVKAFSLVADFYNWGDGNDSLVGTARDDYVAGTEGNDTLAGGSGDDFLNGGEQRNVLWRYGHGGVFSFSDTDVADYSATRLSGVTLNLSNMTVRGSILTGNDTLRGIENVWLTRQSDTVFGSLADLSGNTEGDQHGLEISGYGGSDTFTNGMQVNVPWLDGANAPRVSYAWSQAGINAVFSGSAGTVSYAAAGGGSTAQVAGVDRMEKINALVDTAYSDRLDFSAMTATARPDNASNFVFLTSGNDTVIGNGDTEVRFASNVQGSTVRGISVQMAAGGLAFNVDMTHLTYNGVALGVASLSGVDGVRGTNLNDTLIGGAYEDYETFRGMGGDDFIDGRSGKDLADYWGSNTGVTVNLAAGTASSGENGNNIGNDTLRSIERIRGTDFADTYDARGFSGNSVNAGSNGVWNDFQGLGGNDTVLGNGATRVSYDKSSVSVEVNLGLGFAQALDPTNRVGELGQIVGVDNLSGVSAVMGSALADKLTGGADGRTIGDTPVETFIGGAGNDTIDGQMGWDEADYSTSTSAIVVDLRLKSGQVQDGLGGIDTLRGIEAIGGSQYDDVMVGSDDNNSWAPPVLNLRPQLGVPASMLNSIYVTGVTGGNLGGQQNNLGGDAYLAKFTFGNDKTLSWTKLLGTGSANLTPTDINVPTHSRMGAVATAADGSVYVTGSTSAANLNGVAGNGLDDAYLMKYAADGSLAWTQLLGTGALETSKGIAVDANGAVYITGETRGNLAGNANAGNGDAYLAKFQSDGTRSWVNTLGSANDDRASGVAVGSDGSVYMTGLTTTASTFDGQTSLGNIEVFLTKYSAEGTKAWTKLLGSNDSDAGYAVATASDGSIYVAGATWSTFNGQRSNGTLDSFVTKYSADGAVAWTRLLGTSAIDEAWSVTTGADGSVYVAGETYGALNGQTSKGSYDAYVTKFAADGTLGWTQQIGTSSADIVHSVTVGSDGNVYVAGETLGSLDGNTSFGLADAFISQLTPDGAKNWTKTMGTGANDLAYGVASTVGGSTETNFQLTKVATAGDGSVYYAVAFNGGMINHSLLDGIFNNGADTTDDITYRTSLGSSGDDGNFVLLSSAELTALLPSLDNSAMPTGWNALWSSTLSAADQHMAVTRSGSVVAQSDAAVNYFIVKVQPSGGKQESFAGGQGNDTIDGGGGYDEVSYNYGSPTTGVNVNLATGIAQDGFGTIDTLYNIEGVEGSDLNDTIVGSAADNRLDGRGGDDSIDGGAGKDWIEYNNASGSVRVDLAAGRASGSAGNDTLSGIENVQGSAYGDTLIGDAQVNTIQGGRGNDTMDGGAGVDTAVYSGNFADYTLARNGQFWTVATTNLEDGTDTLARIEKLQFADQTYVLNNAPTGAIKINGLMAQNKVLTASTATLADADGLGNMSYQWRANGVDIKNATGNTFTLTQAEVGKSITLSASYTDGQGNQESSLSSASSRVANVNDAPTGFVKVMGQLQQGQTLKALNTLADADGMGTVSYQWYADAAPVSTGNTLTLQQGHVGKAISVRASYTDAFGKLEVVWSPSTEAVANLNDAPVGVPTIIGNLWAGQTLTAQTTGITDADSVGVLSGFQYQWFADGEAIDSALASTLILTSELVGKAISVEASYVDGGDTEETLLSAATGQIAASETLGVVTVTGNARQGQLLQASVSDDDGVAGVVAWKWFADGEAVAGQTASTLQLSQEQVNKTITASASYTDGHGNVYEAAGVIGALAPVLSTASARVANVNDAPTGAVTITGTAKQFETLTAITSTLADLDGMGSLSYQWKANGVNIAGATGSTFTPNLQSQVGQKISVAVSYTDGFGAKESKTSASTALVLNANDAPTGSIIVSGTPSATGSTLTASNSFVDPDGAVGPVTYSWSMSDPVTGGTSTPLGNGATLAFGAAQVNKNITVSATYSDGVYTNTVVGGVLHLGTTSAETMEGSTRADSLYGEDGNDSVSGAAGDDKLFGGSGNDTLAGGVGSDTLDGGSDTKGDWVNYQSATSGVTVNLQSGTANDGLGGTDILLNLENVIGSAYNDVLTGNLRGNRFRPGAGNDTVNGVDNSFSDDSVEYWDATSAVTVNLKTGTATGGSGTDVLISIEAVSSGSKFNDTITLGDSGWACGNDGNDTLVGGKRDSWLEGEAGNDVLTGGQSSWDMAGYYLDSTNPDSITLSGNATSGWTVSAGSQALLKIQANTTNGSWTVSDQRTNGNWGTDTLTGIEVLDLYGASGSGASASKYLGLGGIQSAPTLTFLEQTGTSGNDVLNGSNYADTLNGGAGNDNLNGGGSDDTLRGGAGDDTLNGGEQRNLAWKWGRDYATSDYDTADYSDVTVGGIKLDLPTMKVTALNGSNVGTDTLRGIEAVQGTLQSDQVVGSFVALSGLGETNGEQHGVDLSLFGGSDTVTVSKVSDMPWIDSPFMDYRWSKTAVNASFSGSVGAISYTAVTGQLAGTDRTDGVASFGDSAYSDRFDFSGMTSNFQTGEDWNYISLNRGGNDTIVGNGNTQVAFSNSKELLSTTGLGIDARLAPAGTTFTVDMTHLSKTSAWQFGMVTLSNINSIRGTNLADTLVGGAYDDLETFNGLGGNDYIDGGTGRDRATYHKASSAVTVNLALGTATGDESTGTDTLRSIESIRGSEYDDVYDARGFSANSTNAGSIGSWNSFEGRGGNDTIYGNGQTMIDYWNSMLAVEVKLGTGKAQALNAADRTGENSLYVGIDTFSGVYSVRGSALGDSLVGSAGDDSLQGFGGNDTLAGGLGNDTFKVDVGTDTVTDFGNGQDILTVAAGATANVTMTAAWNATAATVNNGTVTINTNGYAVNLALAGGTAGFNVINTSTAPTSGTTLTGSSLANVLTSGAGNDTLVGGAGNDTYVVNSASDRVTEQANGGTDTVQLNAAVTSAYQLADNVENLRLMDTAGASSATGNLLDNLIFANGASGVSSVDGGNGNDTLSYLYAAIAGVTSGNAPTTSGVTLNLGGAVNADGYVTASGAFGADLIKGIENLTGSAYADSLTGNLSANVLDGGVGNDTLAGGFGKDILTGGLGADKFLFNVMETTANKDTITDFSILELDKIQFSKSVFNGFTALGSVTAAMLAIDGAAQTTSTRLIYNNISGILSYDADGSGAGQAIEVALIGLTTHTQLTITNVGQFEVVA